MSGYISAAAAVVGTAASIDGARRQKNQAKDAQEAAAAQAKQAAEQAAKQAEDEAKAADQAFNRTNQKKPAAANALPGGGSTMLTGPQGVDPNALTLGKSTLLGQ